MKKSKTIITGVQCKFCKDIIYSRAHYDHHSCTCKATSVDGGRDYLRVGFKEGKYPLRVCIELASTVRESDLENDWRYQGYDGHLPKFGVAHVKYSAFSTSRYTLHANGTIRRHQHD